MLRQVTWRAWAIAAALAGIYAGLGFWLNNNGTVDYQLYRWGLTVLTFAPIVLMAIYTATGNKWWRNDLGSAVGWLAGGITWMAWPLAYTFWFLHGSLGPSWVGWCEVSGPALIALAVLRLCFVFLRYHKTEGLYAELDTIMADQAAGGSHYHHPCRNCRIGTGRI